MGRTEGVTVEHLAVVLPNKGDSVGHDAFPAGVEPCVFPVFLPDLQAFVT